MIELKIAQIFKIFNPKYEVGSMGEYFIILSIDKNLDDNKNYYKIGCFWFNMDNTFGGARQFDLTAEEILEIGQLVGYLPDLIPQQ